MSKNNIKKNLADRLLKLASKEENDRIRKEAQSGRAQLVFVDSLEWLDTIILEMMSRIDANSQPQIKKRRFKRYNNKKDIEKAKVVAQEFQRSFVRRQGLPENQWHQLHAARRLYVYDRKVWEMLKSGNAVLVGSFSTAGELKSAIIDKVLRGKMRAEASILKSKVDRGHGAGAGAAISGIAVAAGAQEIQTILGPEQTEQFLDWLDTNTSQLIQSGEITNTDASLIRDVVVDYKNILKPDGTLQAEYIPYLTFQDKYANRTIDGPREKRIKKMFFKMFSEFPVDEFLTEGASDSLEVQIAKRFFKNFTPLDKRKNIKTKIFPAYKLKSKPGKGKAVSKGKSSGATKVAKNKRAKGPSLASRKRGVASTPLRLIASFNLRLTQKIKENMQPPSLVNRSGRFAESVTVKTVETTPQGFPSFGYTYQMEPYQVFEKGRGAEPWAAQGSRDPRRLIDKTMREIAAEEAMGRFFTRRL